MRAPLLLKNESFRSENKCIKFTVELKTNQVTRGEKGKKLEHLQNGHRSPKSNENSYTTSVCPRLVPHGSTAAGFSAAESLARHPSVPEAFSAPQNGTDPYVRVGPLESTSG